MPDGNTPSDRLAARIARGAEVHDAEVDALYPEWARQLSRVHWTPIEVARKAAAFLTASRGRGTQILDVGSGAGKFCAIAAAATGASCTGLERSGPLVGVARNLVSALGIDNAVFRCSPMQDVDWSGFDGVYLYNPFVEEFRTQGFREHEVPCLWPVYLHYVRSAVARLYLLPPGTRVATFHGFGGTMPPGYQLVSSERIAGGVLRCYVRLDPFTLPRTLSADELLDEVGVFDEPTLDQHAPRARDVGRAPDPDE